MTFDNREDELTRLLADSENRAILTTLDEADEHLSIEDLAERLVERETGIIGSSEYDAEKERTLISLHHRRLPALADAGTVEYDRDEHLVNRRDGAAVERDWVDIEQLDDVLARFTRTASDEGDVAVIEGRDALIDYGVTLANEARAELFCLYVTEDILDESCITSERDAIERGVQMYIGSPDPDVREHCRSNLPKATVWEPQYDWFRNTLQYPKVGRLVLADRERLMVGLVDEPPAGGDAPEIAMIGDGETNPLVVLVRELLGPRLDHLDFQNGEFQRHL